MHSKLQTEDPDLGAPPPTQGPPARGSSAPLIFLLLAVIAGLGWFWAKRHHAAEAEAGTGHGRGPGLANLPVPIVPGAVEQKDVPIYLEGLGNVQAFNTVTVRSRVDGQIQRIAFQEGQDVHVGDLLALVDPAPFQAQLDQAMAKKAQDEAQLAVARITLKRDEDLLAGRVLSQQDYDTQKALSEQLAATVQGDAAAIDNARVQLAYTTITAPLDGRAGLRLIDPGNIVRASEANGIVVLTQLRPIAIVFTLPEQDLAAIHDRQAAEHPLTVFAVDRDNQTVLSEGSLSVIDNQIDSTTGTIRLKATFANQDLKLWPGQFVNVRLLLETHKNGVVVPASVVQRGPEGAFAFVIDADLTARVRPIQVAQIDHGQALIESGLSPGERVVVDGQYKLQPGSKVKLPDGTNAEPARVAGQRKHAGT